jgi:hypothetical protein
MKPKRAWHTSLSPVPADTSTLPGWHGSNNTRTTPDRSTPDGTRYALSRQYRAMNRRSSPA